MHSVTAAKVEKLIEEKEERVRNVCLLAAPTGCASFQLKFGASTLHRIFGIPVGYCGPWKNRTDERYKKMKTRMTQARLFVMDEMSMIGRQMLGKIEFKVRDTLRSAAGDLGEDACLAGRDTVLAGDPKQANPIGDDPLYREGEYTGKGQNKPRGSEGTPSDAWSTHKLVRMGMAVRNSFEDVVLLRQVHRYVDEKAEIPPERREEYRLPNRYRRHPPSQNNGRREEECFASVWGICGVGARKSPGLFRRWPTRVGLIGRKGAISSTGRPFLAGVGTYALVDFSLTGAPVVGSR